MVAVSDSANFAQGEHTIPAQTGLHCLPDSGRVLVSASFADLVKRGAEIVNYYYAACCFGGKCYYARGGEGGHGVRYYRLDHCEAIAFAMPGKVFDLNFALSGPGGQLCTFALSLYGSFIISS